MNKWAKALPSRTQERLIWSTVSLAIQTAVLSEKGLLKADSARYRFFLEMMDVWANWVEAYQQRVQGALIRKILPRLTEIYKRASKGKQSDESIRAEIETLLTPYKDYLEARNFGFLFPKKAQRQELHGPVELAKLNVAILFKLRDGRTATKRVFEYEKFTEILSGPDLTAEESLILVLRNTLSISKSCAEEIAPRIKSDWKKLQVTPSIFNFGLGL